MIPPEFLQQLLGRLDIAEVVGAHVQLKKAGGNLKGLCPFHGEKTPSFNVNPARQTYHCFGCGAHGDAVRFLMEHLGLGFIEAVQDLARRVGLDVPDDRRSAAERAQAAQAKVEQKGLSELLAQAMEHYRGQLRHSERAIAYLKQRGLTGRIAAHFGLGYAPAGWRALARCFPEYDEPDLVTCGLLIQSEEKLDEQGAPRRYDRFRDRIMFPIRNVAGAVIGFGGRVLDQGEPKYLNSPETPVFSKGQELYGLYEARTAIRRAGHALVVEGYMDVVALAQHGLAQGVATLGTACTAEHVAKLFRFTEQIVFSFDGDAAGRRAASRALQAALPHLTERRSVRFLFLPTEHDPDSYVREHGMAAFEAQIEAAKPLSQYLLEVAGEGCRLDIPEGRAKLLAQARPLWTALPDGLLKRQMLGEFAHLARLSDAELDQSWSESPAPRSARAPQASSHGADEPPHWPPFNEADPGYDPAYHPAAQEAHYEPAPARRPMRGERGERWQRGNRRPAGPPPPPPRVASPEDQVLRLLLLNAAWWEQISHSAHDLLLQRRSPHAKILAWLDRIVTDQGPPPWAQLREQMLGEPSLSHSLGQLAGLRLAELDAAGLEQASLSDLQALIERMTQAGQDLSALLGRPAARWQP
ncbi:DNA primase [Inhella inkyongensis]|uniref:DNA primase n=1 Tax=Inhella inkyongensis TaxID=392593 RepID=A0A840S8H1_9BURK|nr:DNA primase [Inhella inkyongensis]MBB5205963.1 DNA primase [Inhella inkyongensis]